MSDETYEPSSWEPIADHAEHDLAAECDVPLVIREPR